MKCTYHSPALMPTFYLLHCDSAYYIVHGHDVVLLHMIADSIREACVITNRPGSAYGAGRIKKRKARTRARTHTYTHSYKVRLGKQTCDR